MNQTITPHSTQLRSKFFRLPTQHKCCLLMILLLCTAWCVHAQNLTVSINGETPLTNQPSLEAAIGSPSKLTSIEITSGTFTAADWRHLRKIKSKVNSFIITDGVKVDSMPQDAHWDYSFFGSAITTISIDAEFTICFGAFTDCRNLDSISLPKVTKIANQAFYRSGNFSTISLPKVTEIEQNAFAFCKTLTHVSLPTVNSIAGNAFWQCTALTSLELGATPPAASGFSFAYCPSQRYLTLVDADGHALTGEALNTAVAAYKAHTGWSATHNQWCGWTLNGSTDGTTGLLDIRHETLSTYPNPTQGEVHVNLPSTGSGTTDMLVYNAAGQLLQRMPAHEFSAGSDAMRIDLSGFPAGVYIIRVGNAAAKIVKM